MNSKKERKEKGIRGRKGTHKMEIEVWDRKTNEVYVEEEERQLMVWDANREKERIRTEQYDKMGNEGGGGTN